MSLAAFTISWSRPKSGVCTQPAVTLQKGAPACYVCFCLTLLAFCEPCLVLCTELCGCFLDAVSGGRLCTFATDVVRQTPAPALCADPDLETLCCLATADVLTRNHQGRAGSIRAAQEQGLALYNGLALVVWTTVLCSCSDKLHAVLSHGLAQVIILESDMTYRATPLTTPPTPFATIWVC